MATAAQRSKGSRQVYGRAPGRLLVIVTAFLERWFRWDRVPWPIGALMLAGIRNRLRRENLHDTGTAVPKDPAVSAEMDPRWLTARTLDGRYNDLNEPAMGSIGCRFGRNVPLEYTHPESHDLLLSPNPRDVSRQLMTRDQFQPATTLNVLAAAWLQFEVHDWFNHGKGSWDAAWQVPLTDDDEWHERPMRIPRATPDPTWQNDGSPPTWLTADSHWWDGSQIYGKDPVFAAATRAGEHGKLRIGADGLPPPELEKGADMADQAGNFWLGLGLLHTIFMLEHNAICDAIRAEHPNWSDEQIYDRARLVNAALMAKIHTVEWTPAVISHPTTRLAMRVNWWGLAGERIKRRFGRISRSEVISGIVGSQANHHGVPYSLTEEFTAVYRMHPLLPDDYTFRSIGDDRVIGEFTFREIDARHTRRQLGEVSVPNAWYSLGVAHPGAITLHNFPRFLQQLNRPDGTVIDLAATDVLRIRERGVPRYNQFRRLFHLKPVRSFEEMTPNKVWQREIREVYNGDLDRVDLMVGLYAEPPPRGFGFSDTAFHVFALMASRRLNSDRFFTSDYRPEVYTRAGLDWIDRNSMVTILQRHYPALAPALKGVENAFTPWRRVAA